MKVCFFLGGLTGNGGIGRVTSILANALARTDQLDVVVLSYADSHKSPLYELDSSVTQAFLLPKLTSMSKAILAGAVGKLSRFLKANQKLNSSKSRL